MSEFEPTDGELVLDDLLDRIFMDDNQSEQYFQPVIPGTEAIVTRFVATQLLDALVEQADAAEVAADLAATNTRPQYVEVALDPAFRIAE